jgi:4-hydroxybenzoyl-CoA thioesterase
MAFRIQQPVRHPDVDRAGIVYFPRFYDFFHRALEDFFREEVGIPYHSVDEALRVAFPVVHVETDFERPLAHGDHVTVELETERVGAHSITVRYRVYRPGGRGPAAVSRVVVCAVEVPGFRKVAVPEPVRRAFERHLVPEAARS